MEWQFTFRFLRAWPFATRTVMETGGNKDTSDSAGDTVLLWDLPWANTRLIQAWAGQPWWDGPVNSSDGGVLAVSWSDALRSSTFPVPPRLKLTFVRMKSSPCPPPDFLRVLDHLCWCCRQPLLFDCTATVPGEPATPQPLCDSSARAESSVSSCSPLIWQQSGSPSPLLLSLLKHSLQTPRPPPSNPCDFLVKAPLPLSLPPASFFPVYSSLNTKLGALAAFSLFFSGGCPVATPEGVTCIGDASPLSHCDQKDRCSPLHSVVRHKKTSFRLKDLCLLQYVKIGKEQRGEEIKNSLQREEMKAQ